MCKKNHVTTDYIMMNNNCVMNDCDNYVLIRLVLFLLRVQSSYSNTLIMGEGKVCYQPPFPSVVALWDDPKLIDVY